MNLNKIITELLAIIKKVEKILLKLVNQAGHSYDSWDDFMNAVNPTEPESSSEATVE